MKSMHILTLDDDRDQLAMLAEFFGYCHECTTCPACDSDEAFAQLRHCPFDLILTDIWHPGINGLELTQIVRCHNGPPVIVMTGNFSPQGRRLAFANGAKACLRKPVKLEWLAEIVELVTGKGVHYIGEG